MITTAALQHEPDSSDVCRYGKYINTFWSISTEFMTCVPCSFDFLVLISVKKVAGLFITCYNSSEKDKQLDEKQHVWFHKKMSLLSDLACSIL